MSNNELEQRIAALEAENRSLKESLSQREAYIRHTFGRYLTDDVLDEILESKENLKIGGFRKTVTMMFTDLRDSTKLSEELSPTDFINLLNNYLEKMIFIVNCWQGNILSFVGDAIVVVFGAPKDNPDSARDAVACAVAMQNRMGKVSVSARSQGLPVLAMGIGIHTGEAVLGNIGSKLRTKYDMIGRNVNLASRIEGYCKGGQILISSETLEAAGDQVILNPSGELLVRPKGISEDIPLHDVIGFGTNLLR